MCLISCLFFWHYAYCLNLPIFQRFMLAIRHRPSWNFIDQGKFVAHVITIIDLFIEYDLRISSPLYVGHSSCSQYQPERVFKEER